MPDMPAIEVYRGCAVHDFQSSERIEQIVKPQIDQALALIDPDSLVAFCADVTRAPEARLAAADRAAAVRQLAAEKHLAQIGKPGEIEALTAGLSDLGWQDPDHIGCLLDPPGPPRPPEERVRLELAQALAHERRD